MNNLTKKNIGSVVLGILGYLGIHYSITITVHSCEYHFVWSLFLVVLAASAWGWKQGLYASVAGSTAFFLVHSNAPWLLLVSFFLYAVCAIWHGYIGEKRKTNNILLYNRYVAQILFTIIAIVLIAIVKALFLIPVFENTKLFFTTTIFPFLYKDLISLFIIIFAVDIILVFPQIRTLFFQVRSPFSKHNTRVMIISFAIGLTLYLLNFLLENHILSTTFCFSSLCHMSSLQLMQLILFILISMYVGSVTSAYLEEQMEQDSLRENTQKQLELVIQKKVEELEQVRDELRITNQDMVVVNEALHLYQLDLELMVDEKVAELHEEQQFKSSILDSIQNTIIVLDNTEKIISTNRHAEQVSGYSLDDLKGKNFIDQLIVESEKESLRKIIADFESQRIPVNARNSIQTRKGDRRLFLWSFSCIVDKSNVLKYVLCSGTDLTERTMLFEALKEREEGYKKLFDNMTSAVVICKPVWNDRGTMVDYIYQDVNPAYEKMIHVNAKEIKGKTYSQVMPINSVDFDELTTIIKTGQPVKKETHNELLMRYFSISIFQYKDGFASTIEDITENKKAEIALISSEVKFKNIFNTTNDIFVISNIDRVIIDANQSFYELSNYTKEDFGTLKITDLIAPLYQDKIAERAMDLAKGVKMPEIEVGIITKKGNDIPVEMTSKLIDFDGTQSILTIMKDIRYRREMDKQLFETMIKTEEDERKRLAGDLHDEVGPLLSSIRLYISTINHQVISDEVNNVLQRVTDILKETIVKVREISHNMSSHLLENHGLKAMVKNVVNHNDTIFTIDYQSNINTQRFTSTIEVVYYRILKELIQNTHKHAGATNLIIVLSYNNEHLSLFYHDNGKGFDVEQTLKSSVNGIGLLNIISRIKSIMGSYSFTSDPQNGFTFEMSVKTFPVEVSN